MGSMTSYFNSTIYRKTMARYWPLWTFFGGMWLFIIPLNLLNRSMNAARWGYGVGEAAQWLAETARDIPVESLQAGVTIAMIYGVLCAMAVFGYLYNSRSACMMHALPPRREALFLSHYLAGLSFSVLPLCAVALITAAVELPMLPGAALGTALRSLGLWLAAECCVSVFFFSFAAFCAMFTGHILALPAFYMIFNGLVAGIYTLMVLLMSCFIYGYQGSADFADWVKLCTPVYELTSAVASYGDNGVLYLRSLPEVAGYAAAGVVFAVLALLVYRERHIESAGDVVSVPLLRPVFRYGVALCAGLSFGAFIASFFGWQNEAVPLTVCVVFCAVIGWFVAEMMLKKTFHVLYAWKGCAVMAAVLVMMCAAFFLDLFGLETKVPAADQVTSVTIGGTLSAPYDSGNPRYYVEVTDPEQIQNIVALHQAIVDDRERAKNAGSADEFMSYLDIEYTLSNGSQLVRTYSGVPLNRDELDQEGSITWAANQLVQDRNLIAAFYGLNDHDNDSLEEVMLQDVRNSLTGNLEDLQVEKYGKELWQAVRQDYQEGSIGVRYLFEDEERMNNTYRTDLVFYFTRVNLEANDDERYESYSVDITLTPQAVHTAQVLEKTGLLGSQYSLQPHSYSDDYGSTETGDTIGSADEETEMTVAGSTDAMEQG